MVHRRLRASVGGGRVGRPRCPPHGRIAGADRVGVGAGDVGKAGERLQPRNARPRHAELGLSGARLRAVAPSPRTRFASAAGQIVADIKAPSGGVAGDGADRA